MDSAGSVVVSTTRTFPRSRVVAHCTDMPAGGVTVTAPPDPSMSELDGNKSVQELLVDVSAALSEKPYSQQQEHFSSQSPGYDERSVLNELEDGNGDGNGTADAINHDNLNNHNDDDDDDDDNGRYGIYTVEDENEARNTPSTSSVHSASKSIILSTELSDGSLCFPAADEVSDPITEKKPQTKTQTQAQTAKELHTQEETEQDTTSMGASAAIRAAVGVCCTEGWRYVQSSFVRGRVYVQDTLLGK